MRKIKYTNCLVIASFIILLSTSYSFSQGPMSGGASETPGGHVTINPTVSHPPIIQPPPEEPRVAMPVEKVSPGVFRLGEIRIYKETRSIAFPAKVNMDKGLLEYILVRSSGKTHESLFRTDVDPYHLQIAFLLLGFEGTDRPIAEQGSEQTPKGDMVEIAIDYMKRGGDAVGGGNVRIKTEEWVVKKINNSFKDTGKLDWVYTGSVVTQGQFLAQSSGSIIAIYHDPAALIDNASPGGESDKIWFVKEGSVQPVGTPVTIIIKAKN
jgi:hypothetical protein